MWQVGGNGRRLSLFISLVLSVAFSAVLFRERSCGVWLRAAASMYVVAVAPAFLCLCAPRCFGLLGVSASPHERRKRRRIPDPQPHAVQKKSYRLRGKRLPRGNRTDFGEEKNEHQDHQEHQEQRHLDSSMSTQFCGGRGVSRVEKKSVHIHAHILACTLLDHSFSLGSPRVCSVGVLRRRFQSAGVAQRVSFFLPQVCVSTCVFFPSSQSRQVFGSQCFSRAPATATHALQRRCSSVVMPSCDLPWCRCFISIRFTSIPGVTLVNFSTSFNSGVFRSRVFCDSLRVGLLSLQSLAVCE